MPTNRRRFLETAAANAAAFAVMPAAALAAMPSEIAPNRTSPENWDLSWTDKLKGKRAVVFDCTEPESGNGVWRASLWKKQNTEILNAAPADLVPVIVLRHDAIILAMQQSFWDKYDTGKTKKVTDPMTNQPTTQNPVVSQGSNADLAHQVATGAIALACNMAFADCVDTVAKRDKVSPEEARKRAIAYLIPGVILQPSGVFAAIHAQNAGATYIKAS